MLLFKCTFFRCHQIKIVLICKPLDLCAFVDMEATYAEYEEWSEHGVPEAVAHQYKKALQQMEKCKPLEEALVADLHTFGFESVLSDFFLVVNIFLHPSAAAGGRTS